MQQQSVTWPRIQFPPINLWSAPKTNAYVRARSETIQEGLYRCGYESRWITTRERGRAMLQVRLRETSAPFETISPAKAVALIEDGV